ncbi:hypothetical protein [Ammoniphilus sp. CFH 90114]|uniref:hypothetical protein n=1 Tax=Ammoniphilus sp. CFH 90114 TaxID=2493665 RepID=UPI00100FC54F|nr:hypothetical protein [Ammoniphilus sp. CFH 90114]RXT03552.1 hypothetical protein EIZ39_23765 [Ammoniphilus sp. CFH 90114]
MKYTLKKPFKPTAYVVQGKNCFWVEIDAESEEDLDSFQMHLCQSKENPDELFIYGLKREGEKEFSEELNEVEILEEVTHQLEKELQQKFKVQRIRILLDSNISIPNPKIIK